MEFEPPIRAIYVRFVRTVCVIVRSERGVWGKPAAKVGFFVVLILGRNFTTNQMTIDLTRL